MKTKLLALFLLISTFAFSQKYFTSYQVQSGRYNKYTKEWSWSESQDQEIDIKLNGSTIYIYNKTNTVIYTYENFDEKTDYDKDGDRFKMNTWRAYDDKQRKCLFIMIHYTDIPLIIYSVVYGDTGFRFYIKKNQLSNFKP